MLYLDTSFLVPLVLPEATSGRIAAFARELSGELTVSQWTRVEFSSLLSRKARIGGFDPWAATQADARFEAMVESSFAVLLPNATDFTLAKQFLGKFETGLRAGDALQLAIASNHRAAMIYSLDKTLLKAGKILGLQVSMGIRAR